MAGENPTDRESSAVSPSKHDEILERAVLTQVLILHPAQLTILELALKMDAAEEEFTSEDAVERAVRELSRDGLLTCDCRRIAPSRAAMRFEELLGGVS